MDLSLRVGAILALMLAAAACAASAGPEVSNQPAEVASEPDMRQQLIDADGSCKAVRWKAAVDMVSCYDGVERPIWQHLASAYLDLFEGFAAHRAQIAEDYDHGARSLEQAKQAWLENKAAFESAITERRAAQAQASAERGEAAPVSAPHAAETPQENGDAEETPQPNDAYQDCVLRVQLASSLAFLTRSPGTAYFNAAAAGLRQCNALLQRRPVPAQTYQPDSGSTYDWRSGNRYSWRRNSDGSTTLRGFNAETGSTWRQTIEPNGDQRGVDSRGNYWRYNDRTGYYWNSDGTICTGRGAARTCQ